jgi:transposase
LILGVDTHAETHTAAVIDERGRLIDTLEIATTLDGFARLLAWASALGRVRTAGVEGTGAYGRSLATFLIEHNVTVFEVNRPNRQHRRRHGKSDPTDALAAARAVLSGEASSVPKQATGLVEALRMLHLVRRSAVKAKTQAGNQIKDLVLTAPEPIRAQLRHLNTRQRARLASIAEPCQITDARTATTIALRTLAQRWLQLDQEIKSLERQIWPLLRELAPKLLAEHGVGLDVAAKLLIAAGQNPQRLHTEAAFAALCGASPVDASSGKQQRHRLNRGGNRQANNALHTVVLIRVRTCSETRAYIERRRAEGKTNREIWRCLKRTLARRFHRILVHELAALT